MFSLSDLEFAAAFVRETVPPTPQHVWPLLCARTASHVVVKHENHTPIGAFKVRGGLTYMDRLKRDRPHVAGVVTATRGNHGQSVAFAAGRAGLPATIVVPFGNSAEKNAAMRAFGAELIEHGRDFDEARQRAAQIAEERNYEMIPSFHWDLVLGVATYALELFRAAPDLDAVYCSIGLGSGINGLIRTRDLLNLKTQIIGVVTAAAPAYALSFEAGHVIVTNSANTFADGMACRVPDPVSLAAIRAGAERIIRVSDDEIAEAARIYHTDTHNLAEGAGAAPLAGFLKEGEAMRGRRVGVILTGGNIDRAWAAEILMGKTPVPA